MIRGEKMHHRHYNSFLKGGLFSLGLVVAVTAAGTIGMHLIENMRYIDAFYFMSMIATAQGPALMPATDAGKIFASFISFISVGTVVAALGFLFGPFFGKLWRVGVVKLEEEMHYFDKSKNEKEK